MHDKKAIEGLIKKLGTARSADLRREILATLIRLYYGEAEYTGLWWGIRPENSGPYFDAEEWDQTPRIGSVITSAVLDADPDTANFLRKELARHRVELEGLPKSIAAAAAIETVTPLVVRVADPNNPNQIGNMTFDAATGRTLRTKGDAAKGKTHFKTQSCNACHTDADGQTLKGPHLVDIGKRYNATELIESILKPSAKIAQGFETYLFEMEDGRTFTGFVVSQRAKSIMIREANGVPRELKLSEIESKVIQKQSNMPEGIANNLTPEELADLVAYLQSLVVSDPNAKASDPLPASKTP
jgi:putative heme-binding domain-containing protein